MCVCVCAWLRACVVAWLGARTCMYVCNVCMHVYLMYVMDGWMDGLMDGLMDGWTDRRMDRWMDG